MVAAHEHEYNKLLEVLSGVLMTHLPTLILFRASAS